MNDLKKKKKRDFGSLFPTCVLKITRIKINSERRDENAITEHEIY